MGASVEIREDRWKAYDFAMEMMGRFVEFTRIGKNFGTLKKTDYLLELMQTFGKDVERFKVILSPLQVACEEVTSLPLWSGYLVASVDGLAGRLVALEEVRSRMEDCLADVGMMVFRKLFGDLWFERKVAIKEVEIDDWPLVVDEIWAIPDVDSFDPALELVEIS
jgi:hypothetical protein